jgi:ribose 5-phosphate isomerase B
MSPILPMGASMKIAIGSDHAGFRYKQELIAYLHAAGHHVVDMGTHSEEPVSYVTYIRKVALAVVAGEVERGIVLGGSGNGEAMAANRIRGVRCGLCWNTESARLARLHNDANVLSIGQRMLDLQTALAIVDQFLTVPFEGGRHLARIQQLDE